MLVIPGAAVSLAVTSWRDGVGVHQSTRIVPAVLLTSPDHGDRVPAAETLDCLLSDSPDGTRQLARCGRI